MSYKDQQEIQEGEVWRAKVTEHKDLKQSEPAEETDYLVIPVKVKGRFDYSKGIAYKVLGSHMLIPPENCHPYAKVSPSQYGMLLHELHEQGSRITVKFQERILELLSKKDLESKDE